MKLGGGEKEAVRKLSDAVNLAVERSQEVLDAIENLRALGFEPDLILRLEIGLQKTAGDREEFTEEIAEEISLDLTKDDVRELRRMKIKVD